MSLDARSKAVEALLSLPALALMALLGVSSVKVTSGGQSRLVERLAFLRLVVWVRPEQAQLIFVLLIES